MQDNNFISNNPFNINVNTPNKAIPDLPRIIKEEIKETTINPFVNYFNEYEKVFTGEVAKEINKFHSQIYTLGQVMREGQAESTFKMKM